MVEPRQLIGAIPMGINVKNEKDVVTRASARDAHYQTAIYPQIATGANHLEMVAPTDRLVDIVSWRVAFEELVNPLQHSRFP